MGRAASGWGQATSQSLRLTQCQPQLTNVLDIKRSMCFGLQALTLEEHEQPQAQRMTAASGRKAS